MFTLCDLSTVRRSRRPRAIVWPAVAVAALNWAALAVAAFALVAAGIAALYG